LAVEGISERVMGFGFTQDEAKYLMFLSIMGPTPIRSIVRRFGGNRVKVYRTLKKLEEQGFVERTMGRPVKYIATPLDESLQKAIDEIKTRLTDLESAKREILDEWGRLSEGLEEQPEEPRFRIHQGRQQIYDQLLQMCERAKREVFLVTTENDLHRLALFGLDDTLKSMADNGIKINILTQVESIEFDEIGQYYEFTATRHVPLPSPVRFVVIDDSEALVTVSMDDAMRMNTQDDTGLWTNATSFISVMNVFYDALWSLASDVSSVIQAMKTGKALQEMKTLRSQEEFHETLVEMIRRSQSSMDILIKDFDPPVLFDETVSALKRDVECRILTQLNIDNMNKFNEISDQARIRHFMFPSTMSLLVVDETEVLMNIPSWQARDQSLWSDMTAYIETMLHMFDDYWERGEAANDVISRLSSQQSYQTLLQSIQNTLVENDWRVESPGVIQGKSGQKHTFNLVAHPPEKPDLKQAIDCMDEENPLGQITMTGAKKFDLTNVQIALISDAPVGADGKNLVELYGIKLVDAAGVAGLLREVLNSDPTLT
jgi:sugar-specific transcriptional regulator TrmB